MKKELIFKGARNVRGNKNLKDVIIEVSPKLRNILAGNYTNVVWKSVLVRDHISILQCYKCYEIGHKSTECENTQKCGKCAGDHDYKDCTEQKTECIMCKRTNAKTINKNEKVPTDHDTKSPNCSTWKRYGGVS